MEQHDLIKKNSTFFFLEKYRIVSGRKLCHSKKNFFSEISQTSWVYNEMYLVQLEEDT